MADLSNSTADYQLEVLSLGPAQEGQSLAFKIVLDSPAKEDLTITFSTSSDSQNSMVTTTPYSGTVIIPKGQKEIIAYVPTSTQFGYQGNRSVTLVIDSILGKKIPTPLEAVSTIIETAHQPGLLKDINKAPDQIPHAYFNGYIYFAGYHEDTGFELWRTNGIETSLVKDILPGPRSSLYFADMSSSGSLYQFVIFQGVDPTPRLYFFAKDENKNLLLYKTDGTSAGTVPVVTNPTLLTDFHFTGFLLGVINNKLVFEFYNESRYVAEPWATDGTDAGTYTLSTANRLGGSNVPSTRPVVYNGALYYGGNCNDSDWMSAFCKTDGTLAGSSMVYQTAVMGNWGDPTAFVVCNNKLFMGTLDWPGHSTTDELYVSNGTTAGTSIVKKITSPATMPSSVAKPLACVNDKVIFSATSAAEGLELWTSDGTAAATVLLKDITAGASGSVFTTSHGPTNERKDNFLTINNILYFYTSTPSSGMELWRSDGTNAGTYLLKDIYPGTESSWPHNFTEVNGKLVFVANDGLHGFELWVSDGTSNGTTMVADLAPGLEPSSPENITSFPGVSGFPDRLFFTAYNPSEDSPTIAWSDLTPESTIFGTHRTPSEDSYPNTFLNLANAFIFTADDGTWGNQLWTSDGTEGGTQIFQDIAPNAGCMAVSAFLPNPYGVDRLFVTRDPQHGSEIWRTDGTAAGTTLVKDINPGPGDGVMSLLATESNVQVNGKILFMANDGVNGWELWATDGTNAGTQLLKDMVPGSAGGDTQLANYSGFKKFPDGRILLNITTSTYGSELWITDGTTAGTFLLKDIFPGTPSGVWGAIRILAEFTGPPYRIVFEASTSNTDREPWITDGTTAGTIKLADFQASTQSFPRPLGVFGPSQSLITDDYMGPTTWITDGTPAGTQKMVTYFSTKGLTAVTPTMKVNNKYLFQGTTAATGTEFWVTDGSLAGTQLLKEVTSGSGGIVAVNFYRQNPDQTLAIFGVKTTADGIELWRTDGTASGTYLLKDINPGAADGVYNGTGFFNWIPSLNGWLFAGQSDTDGVELWFTDGTSAGTYRISDIDPGPASGFSWSPILYKFSTKNQWLFTATSASLGRELWSTDGTAANTKLLKDLNTGSGSSNPSQFYEFQGAYYFWADQVGGKELWKTDGTTAGTVPLTQNGFTMGLDYSEKLLSNDYSFWGIMKNKMYFLARDPVHGKELWMSDGTPAGTKLFSDITPGPDDTLFGRVGYWENNSVPSFSIYNEMLFFRAKAPLTGYELFILYPEY